MEFKVGDILEFNPKCETYGAKKGSRAIFKGIDKTLDHKPLITVEWIRDKLSGNQKDGGYFMEDFEKIEQMIDFKVKGTKLPTIPKGIRFRCVGWMSEDQKTEATFSLFVSFGYEEYNGETYILCESQSYPFGCYYMIPLSEVNRLAIEQDMIKEETKKSKYFTVELINVDDIDRSRGYKVGDRFEVSYHLYFNHYLVKDSNEFFHKEQCQLIEDPIKTQKIETMQKLTVSIKDVLKIHQIACSDWKIRIAKFLTRVDSDQNITFTQQEIDTMFDAATTEQKPTLIRVFGEKTVELDFMSNNIEFKVDGIDVFGDRHISVTSAFISLPDDIDEKNGFHLNPNYDWTLKDGFFLSCSKR